MIGRDAIRAHLGTSRRVLRAVLRNPALRRVQLAFLLFNAAEFGTWVAVLLYAYDATGPASLGVVALAQLAPAAVFAPFAASLADRFPRGRVLFAGYLVQALAFGLTAAGMLLDAPPAAVYIAAAGAAASLTFTRPAQGSLLPSLSRTPDELTAANSLSGTVEGVGLLLGPLAAAAILAVGTPGAVFGIAAACGLLAALLVVRLPRPALPVGAHELGAHGHADGGASGLTLVTGGLRALAASGDTRLVVGILGLRMLASGSMDVLFVLLALQVFHTGESGAGILNAALGAGTVLGGAASFALVGRRRLAPALALGALAWGGALLAVGTLASALLAPLVLAIGGMGFAVCDVTGRTILQRVTPDRMLARVLGALEGIGLAALAVGSLLVPVLASAVGVTGALVAVGLLLPAGVAVAWTHLREIDRRATVPVRELALLGRSPVFAPLAPPQLETAARRTRWMTFEAGDVLIREGDEGDRYYILESGELRISRAGRILRTSGDPGYGVGETALLHDVPRTATVTATRPSVVLALERGDFLEAVTGHDAALGMTVPAAARRFAGPDEGGDRAGGDQEGRNP